MRFARIRNNGQLTLPAAVRKAANLEDGDLIEVEVSDEGNIILRPKKLHRSQAWFWTESWQEGEREASSERDAGLGKVSHSDEAFLAGLSPIQA